MAEWEVGSVVVLAMAAEDEVKEEEAAGAGVG